jgi:hypothetical protein
MLLEEFQPFSQSMETIRKVYKSQRKHWTDESETSKKYTKSEVK